MTIAEIHKSHAWETGEDPVSCPREECREARASEAANVATSLVLAAIDTNPVPTPSDALRGPTAESPDPALDRSVSDSVGLVAYLDATNQQSHAEEKILACREARGSAIRVMRQEGYSWQWIADATGISRARLNQLAG